MICEGFSMSMVMLVAQIALPLSPRTNARHKRKGMGTRKVELARMMLANWCAHYIRETCSVPYDLLSYGLNKMFENISETLVAKKPGKLYTGSSGNPPENFWFEGLKETYRLVSSHNRFETLSFWDSSSDLNNISELGSISLFLHGLGSKSEVEIHCWCFERSRFWGRPECFK